MTFRQLAVLDTIGRTNFHFTSDKTWFWAILCALVVDLWPRPITSTNRHYYPQYTGLTLIQITNQIASRAKPIIFTSHCIRGYWAWVLWTIPVEKGPDERGNNPVQLICLALKSPGSIWLSFSSFVLKECALLGQRNGKSKNGNKPDDFHSSIRQTQTDRAQT
jgi:hypothetical protein